MCHKGIYWVYYGDLVLTNVVLCNPRTCPCTKSTNWVNTVWTIGAGRHGHCFRRYLGVKRHLILVQRAVKWIPYREESLNYSWRWERYKIRAASRGREKEKDVEEDRSIQETITTDPSFDFQSLVEGQSGSWNFQGKVQIWHKTAWKRMN